MPEETKGSPGTSLVPGRSIFTDDNDSGSEGKGTSIFANLSATEVRADTGSIFADLPVEEKKIEVVEPVAEPTGPSMFNTLPVEAPKRVRRVFRLRPFVPDVVDDAALLPYLTGAGEGALDIAQRALYELRGLPDEYEPYITYGHDKEEEFGSALQALMTLLLDDCIVGIKQSFTKIAEQIEASGNGDGWKIAGLTFGKDDENERHARLTAAHRIISSQIVSVKRNLELLGPVRENIKSELDRIDRVALNIDAYHAVLMFLIDNGDRSEVRHFDRFLSVLQARAQSLLGTRLRISEEKRIEGARLFVTNFTITTQSLVTREVPSWTQIALSEIHQPKGKALAQTLLQKLRGHST